VISSAEFSSCRTWRYSLRRTWDARRSPAMFVGLNPSTADETRDDPTIRRCIRFARDWGYGGVVMVNLYAFRATKPTDLHVAAEPVGPGNDEALEEAAAAAGLIVAAWGADPGPHPLQPRRVLRLVRPYGEVHVLGLTKAGQPRHPLYMRADVLPVPFESRAAA
jgi:hypothetical protein